MEARTTKVERLRPPTVTPRFPSIGLNIPSPWKFETNCFVTASLHTPEHFKAAAMAAEKPDKKEKKDKKRSDESGVSKSKKEKKEKKDKKEKLAAALEEKIQQDAAPSAAVNANEDSDMEEDKVEELPLERTVVPFAVPVADEKGMKKIYKTIRKGMLRAWRT